MHAPCLHQLPKSLISIHRFRKFFGRPTGSSPKPQQSKLAFQKSHTTNTVKNGHEDVDGVTKTEDRETADGVKSEIADEDVDMDSNSELHKPAVDTKRADPVADGMDKADSALPNGEGEMSI